MGRADAAAEMRRQADAEHARRRAGNGATVDDAEHARRHQAAALAYAIQLGWPVFPVHAIVDGRCSCGKADCENPGKHPRTPHGLKDATTDTKQITAWWRKWPDANVGLPTGAVSGADALDVDARAGGDDTLAKLEAAHGELPATVTQLTGGGGRHLLFSHAEGLRNSAGKLGPGLDVRGDGGYIVVAPSTHASGRAYAWEVSSRPGEVGIALWPTWLLEALQHPENGRPQAVEGRIPEGRRNETLTSLGGAMRRRGMGEEAILAALRVENAARCDPPLSGAEVEAIARNVARYEPAAADDDQARRRASNGAAGVQGEPRPDATDGDAQAEPEPRRKLVLAPASAITPRPVRWIWKDEDGGRIPAGEITITPGPGGVGKSTFHAWVVARLTRGQLPGMYFGSPRPCIICATEDSWAQTLVPRLIVAGADLDMVFRVEVVENSEALRLMLPDDVGALAAAIQERGVALVSLDPLMTLIAGNLDTHKDHEVRRALEPLKQLADDTGCAVLGNAHFNKGLSSDPMMRITGSAAFGQVVRAVLAFARDTEGGRCVISQVKNNLGRLDLPSLAYRIEGVEIPTAEGPASVGQLVFCGKSDRSVQDILGATDEEWQAGTQAEDLLREVCQEEALAADVIAQGAVEGIAKRTMQRAARKLCERRREGFGKGAVIWWKLRADAIGANRCHRRQSQSVAPMAPMDDSGASDAPTAEGEETLEDAEDALSQNEGPLGTFGASSGDSVAPGNGHGIICERCEKPLPARKTGPGRPAKYCGDDCRKRAWQARRTVNRWEVEV